MDFNIKEIQKNNSSFQMKKKFKSLFFFYYLTLLMITIVILFGSFFSGAGKNVAASIAFGMADTISGSMAALTHVFSRLV